VNGKIADLACQKVLFYGVSTEVAQVQERGEGKVVRKAMAIVEG
jgi:hypothetical protein